MANQNAIKDDNHHFSELGSNAAGTETRRKVITDNGAQLFSESLTDDEDSVFRTLDADETEEQAATGDARLRGYIITNRANAERSVKLYEGLIANVTVGTTVPKITIPLAAGQSANLRNLNVKFTAGIAVAATTGVADNDTGAPGANEVVVNLFYRAA